MKNCLLTTLLLLTCLPSLSRDPSQVREFRRHNPCPSTLRYTGRCTGYVVDHVIPLCAMGPDLPSNMRWQEYRESLIKDAEERRVCRKLKHSLIVVTTTGE
jgi:hypothetical protein